jgi:hypothetical protein
MSNHLNIEKGRLYPQPGCTVQVDKDGKWTATQIYYCHRLSAVALMPRPGTSHPEISFITVSTASISFGEGDTAEITCQYAGAEDKSAEDEKANAKYSMGLSVNEEPLLTNVRYKDLIATEREAIQMIASGKDKDDQGNKLRDKVTSERGVEALTKIDRGQTTVYNPRVTWKESWVRNRGVEAAELNKIANIDVPSGPAPALARDRNWLRNGVTQEQDGRAYAIAIEWLASNPGGWDSDLYSA